MFKSSEIDHPSDDELCGFLEGCTDSRRAKELESHINSCQSCSRFVEEHCQADQDKPLIRWAENGQMFIDRATMADPSHSDDGKPSSAGGIELKQLFSMAGSVDQSFDNYRLNRVIGEGGNGIVYHATQLRPLVRTVAIKFAKVVSTGGDPPHRFTFEQQTLASLQHPCIPQIYDAGMTKAGVPYFVMEYIDGQRLSHYMCDHRLPINDCLELMSLLCECVQYAHRNGVIHRDLKPSNVLLKRDKATGQPDIRRPRLIDFGIAKSVTENCVGVTGPNEFIGTLEYMSPEQLEAKPKCDIRSDVYSLGLILYELLSFRLPFPGDELNRLPLDTAIRRVRCDEPTPPSRSLNPNLEPPLDNPAGNVKRSRQLQGDLDWIVMKAIDRNADCRYQSAALLADDIQNYMRGDLVNAAPPSIVHKTGKLIRKHRGIFAASVVVSIALLVTATMIAHLLNSTIMANKKLTQQLYVTQIQNANELLERGGTSAAIEILGRQRDDSMFDTYRGLEWQMLWQRANPDAFLAETKAFAEPIDDLTVSSRSRIAVISRRDQRIKVFAYDRIGIRQVDVIDTSILTQAAPQIVNHWETHATDANRKRAKAMSWARDRSPLLSCIEFTPDGDHLAIGTCSGFTLLWHLKDRRVTRFIDCQSDLIYRIEISDDQRWLLTLGTAARLVDLQDEAMAMKPVLLYETEQSRRADFSPDNQFLVIADKKQNLLFWELDSQEFLFSQLVNVRKNLDHSVTDVQFSPDGMHIVSSMTNGKIYRRPWRNDRLGQVDVLGSTRDAAEAIRFSSDHLLGSVCYGGVLQYWDLQQFDRPNEVAAIAGHSGYLSCLESDDRMHCFVTAGEDGSVRVYDAIPDPRVFTTSGQVTCLAIDSTGTRFAMGHDNGRIELRRTDDAKIVRSWQHPSGSVAAVSFSPNRNDLIAAFSDTRVKILDINSGEIRKEIKLRARCHHLMAQLANNEFAVSCRDGTITTFSENGDLVDNWAITAMGLPGVFSLGSQNQIVSCGDGHLDFWDLQGNPTESIDIDPKIVNAFPHPSGNVWICYGTQGHLVAIDRETGKTLRQYRGHVGSIWRVVCADQGKRLISIGADSTARFWDYDSGLQTLMLDATSKKIHRFAMSESPKVAILVYSNRRVEIISLDNH